MPDRLVFEIAIDRTLFHMIDEARGNIKRNDYISDALAKHVGYKQECE